MYHGKGTLPQKLNAYRRQIPLSTKRLVLVFHSCNFPHEAEPRRCSGTPMCCIRNLLLSPPAWFSISPADPPPFVSDGVSRCSSTRGHTPGKNSKMISGVYVRVLHAMSRQNVSEHIAKKVRRERTYYRAAYLRGVPSQYHTVGLLKSLDPGCPDCSNFVHG